MRTIEQQIKLFKGNRIFENENQYLETMSEYDEIYNSQDVERVYPLLYVIDDNSEHSEITQVFVDGILSFYEFDKHRFIEIILTNIDLLYQNAKEWLEIIIIRLTNNLESNNIISEILPKLLPKNINIFKNVYFEVIKKHEVCVDNRLIQMLEI